MEGVAIITGGTRGLGLALVEKWLNEDWALATCARSADEVSALPVSDQLLAQALDVTDREAVLRFVAATEERFGRIDLLINNAAIAGPRAEILEYPPDEWRAVMDVNVDGPFHFIQAVLPGMLRRRSGVILNISSGAGIKGSAKWGAYAASKFALEGVTQVLRNEVQDLGVRVHAIDPGAMRTSMRAGAYPDEDPMTLPAPSRIAQIIFDIAAVYEPQLGRLSAKDYL